MSVKYNLSNAAAIASSITKWAGRGKAVKEEGQTIAIGLMEHMDKHGDYTMTDNLFNATKIAFGNGLQLAMKEYFLKYTWLAYDEEKKEFVKDKAKVMNLEGAKKEKWYDIERKARDNPFDAQKAVDSLLSKALKSKANLVELRAYLDRKVEEQLAKMPVAEAAAQIDEGTVTNVLSGLDAPKAAVAEAA